MNAAAAYTDAKTKENICELASDTTPDCDLILCRMILLTPEDETERDIITAPKGTRLPVTPKFKIHRRRRAMPGTWVRASARPDRPGPPGLGSLGLENRRIRRLLGTLPGLTMVDLFAGYDWGRNIVSSCSRTNIFDKRNQLSRFFVCGSNCETNEFIHIVPGRPRTIGIRAGAKF